MNFFDYFNEFGDVDYTPKGPPTDRPMIEKPRNTRELQARIDQLISRLERGEDLFHPDEKPIAAGIPRESPPYLMESARGYRSRTIPKLEDHFGPVSKKVSSARPIIKRRKTR